jgi:hypothetical protein
MFLLQQQKQLAANAVGLPTLGRGSRLPAVVSAAVRPRGKISKGRKRREGRVHLSEFDRMKLEKRKKLPRPAQLGSRGRARSKKKKGKGGGSRKRKEILDRFLSFASLLPCYICCSRRRQGGRITATFLVKFVFASSQKSESIIRSTIQLKVD